MNLNLNLDKAVAMLTAPQVRLAFDTNALFRERSFADLCRDLKRLSTHRQTQLELLVFATPICVLEPPSRANRCVGPVVCGWAA